MGRALALQGQTVPSPGRGARAGCATSQPSALRTSRDTPEAGRQLCLHISARRLPPGSLICLRQPPAWCSPSTSPPSPFLILLLSTRWELPACASHNRSSRQELVSNCRGSRTYHPRSWLCDTTFLPPFYSKLECLGRNLVLFQHLEIVLLAPAGVQNWWELRPEDTAVNECPPTAAAHP